MHTSETKSILACLFARLDSKDGNRETVEMEVLDVQGPEQGTLYFMTKQECALSHLGSSPDKSTSEAQHNEVFSKRRITIAHQ